MQGLHLDDSSTDQSSNTQQSPGNSTTAGSTWSGRRRSSAGSGGGSGAEGSSLNGGWGGVCLCLGGAGEVVGDCASLVCGSVGGLLVLKGDDWVFMRAKLTEG